MRAPRMHSCALLQTGAAMCWGNNRWPTRRSKVHVVQLASFCQSYASQRQQHHPDRGGKRPHVRCAQDGGGNVLGYEQPRETGRRRRARPMLGPAYDFDRDEI